MTLKTDPDLVRSALMSLDYPADKQTVVRHAIGAGARDEAIKALSALPLGTYDSIDEILRSIPRDPAEGEDLGDGEHGLQTRAKSVGSRSRIAEHLREP
ncbi:DUF2795 domain-containing protein [Planobispora takensis]|uniref:DUF2795 domain-containing protein n=1 Tax=Planobispora takensis TaxID=1367882 RepID=A0A8J3SYF0_9ACTN|nr:DUF2795 domain-containing protein [Planobispora takensis]GII01610.1 hypothetical protein Pta02_36180 [Planobispora takensis]